MKHRTGLERSQTLLFPERLAEYVTAENPVRFLDAFVANEDLAALGFTNAGTGLAHGAGDWKVREERRSPHPA